MKKKEMELLVLILKSDLSSRFKEELLRELFIPKTFYKVVNEPMKIELYDHQ